MNGDYINYRAAKNSDRRGLVNGHSYRLEELDNDRSFFAASPTMMQLYRDIGEMSSLDASQTAPRLAGRILQPSGGRSTTEVDVRVLAVT